MDGNDLEIWCDFRPARDIENIRRFAGAMKQEGYEPTIEPWNVGLGEDLESVSVKYRLPCDAALVERLTYICLDSLQGSGGVDLHVRAALIKDGPGGKVKFERKRDPLEGLV